MILAALQVVGAGYLAVRSMARKHAMEKHSMTERNITPESVVTVLTEAAGTAAMGAGIMALSVFTAPVGYALAIKDGYAEVKRRRRRNTYIAAMREWQRKSRLARNMERARCASR